MYKSEPFTYDETDFRLTMYPIRRPELWDLYVKSRACFWGPDEISLTHDLAHYNKLNKTEQNLIDHILAFFASADSLVNMNLLSRFTNEVKFAEANAFYSFQVAMEVIHSEVYSRLIEAIIINPEKRQHLYKSLETMPIILKMAKYIYECINSDSKFSIRLLRMACVEGIFFSGCFCIIYWLSSRGLMPGLAHSNELIARDESLHTMFALELYKLIKIEERPSIAEIHEVFKDACNIAFEFVASAITDNMVEMNAANMKKYIEFITDNLLSYIDVPILFGSKNEFHFMIKINLMNRTNFFERRVSEYSGLQGQKNEYMCFDF